MKYSIPLMLCLVISVAVCSYFQLGFVPYLVSAVVVGIILLVAFKKIPQNRYPIYIVGLSASMILQQTMLGSYIVGTDIHQEFYMVNKTIAEGWDWQFYFLNGTSVLLNVVAPILHKIGIPVIWQFKLLYPIVLAFVPWILYIAFSKQIGERKGFYAAIFFIIVPVFTVEISTICKSMVADLFFALIVLTLFSVMGYLKKFLLLSLYGILAVMCHYTVGTLVFGYLGLSGLILLGYGIVKKNIKFAPVIGAVMVIGLIGGIWFYNTGGGIVYKGYTNSYVNIAKQVSDNIVNSDPPPSEQVAETQEINYLNNQDSLVKTALGMDWNDTSLSGKLFRIIQYITQIAIILGVLFLFINRKKYRVSFEFGACLVASLIILICVLFAPYVSTIINTTRWYHSALFFVSPLLVASLYHIGREKLIVSVLVVYYIFTSGFVFTLTQSEVPQKNIETPYSISYSNKLGIMGIFNNDDVKCAKWMEDNIGDNLVHTGFTDTYLFLGYIEFNGQFVEHAPKQPHYLFLSSQNNQLKKMSVWSEPGMRKMVSLPDTSNMTEVYRQGESVIYVVR